MCMADIRIAYLQSQTSQKHYIICEPEFEMENVGKVTVMHMAVSWWNYKKKRFQKPSSIMHGIVRELDLAMCFPIFEW